MSSILSKLTTQGSVLSNLNGAPGPQPNFKLSKLHYEYSLNGNPNVVGKPSPSILDMNGKTPTYNYRDNSPEGRTF
jgi:hypothetical protein